MRVGGFMGVCMAVWVRVGGCIGEGGSGCMGESGWFYG